MAGLQPPGDQYWGMTTIRVKMRHLADLARPNAVFTAPLTRVPVAPRYDDLLQLEQVIVTFSALPSWPWPSHDDLLQLEQVIVTPSV